MRSRGWVWITVVVILAVLVAGFGAAAVLDGGGGGSSRPSAPSDAASDDPASAASIEPGVFELRQVLFQESGQIQRKPPLAPGPATGGKNATGDLLRIDCALQPRPTSPSDNVILCDGDGFRYGLGPSELPATPVASAIPLQGAFDDWVVQVELTAAAAPAFVDMTRRVSALGPPLNQVAIVLNDAVVSAPVVREPIKGSTLLISGTFTQGEAEALAASLG
jgi:hypothetical protein